MSQVKHSIEEIERAQKIIEGSFWWADTSQGPDYWARVFENLEAVRVSLSAQRRDERTTP